MKKGIKIAIAIGIILIIMVVGIALFMNNNKHEEKQYTIEQIEDYTYFVLKENGKYGVINKQGNKVIEPVYDEVRIPNPEKELFICYTGDKSDVLNSKGEKILTQYEQVEPIRLKNVISNLMYEKSILTYVKNGKMGLVDFEGNEITQNKYDSIETLPSQEGKLLVKQNEKFGIINIKGYELVKCNYDKVDTDGYYEENSGYQYAGYIVSNTTNEGYRYGYINYKGEEIIKPECNELSRVTDIQDEDNCYLILAKNGQYGVYKNNQELVESEYQSIQYEPKNEVFTVEKSKIYGVVNLKSETVLPLEYDQIDITGICIYAKKGDEVKVFNKYGEQMNMDTNISILDTENEKYKIVLESGDGITSYGVMDNSGNQVIPKEYNYIEYLNNNYFIVANREGKLGVLDDKNNEILEQKYASLQKIEGTNILKAGDTDGKVTEFYSDKMEKICDTTEATVNVKENYLYITDENGTKYINLQTNKEELNTEVFKNNELFSKNENGKWGFVDKNGNTKIECKYDKVTEFNEFGYAGIKSDGKWGVVNKNGEIIQDPTYEIPEENEMSLSFIGKYYSVEYGFGEVYYTNEVLTKENN